MVVLGPVVGLAVEAVVVLPLVLFEVVLFLFLLVAAVAAVVVLTIDQQAVELVQIIGFHIMEELLTPIVVALVATVLVMAAEAVAVAVGQVDLLVVVLLDLITPMVAVAVAEETPIIEVI